MLLQAADQSFVDYMVQTVGPAALVFLVGVIVIGFLWLFWG